MPQTKSQIRPRRRTDGDPSARSVPWSAAAPTVKAVPVGEARATALLELALSVSGGGLAIFMASHLALHLTVLVGAEVYDAVAEFMERYYLLHAVVPPLVVWFFVHVFLALRRVPTSYGQQKALLHHARSLAHLDTWTWIVQILTGAAILVLGFTHIWVIVADLPIEAAKSGARVSGIYAWYYVPFEVVVYPHMMIGLYRIAVKWWPVSRPWAHRILVVGTLVVMALAAAVLITLFSLGRGQ